MDMGRQTIDRMDMGGGADYRYNGHGGQTIDIMDMGGGADYR